MTQSIHSVPGAPPKSTTAERMKRAAPPLTPEQRTQKQQRRAEQVERWKAIETAGGVELWVRAQLVAKGFNPDEPVPSDDAGKKAFKERRAAERVEKKALLALARDARRAAKVLHLGAGFHWDEYTDADTFDVAEREARAEQNGLPKLETVDALATAMGLTVADLRWFTYQRRADTGTHYRRWQIPKRDGGQRTITSPKQKLMAAQHWALRNVFEKLPVHGAAHGFLPARSVATNALAHAGADVILKVDIKDFFPTVTWRRVKGLLRKAGATEQVATILALLVTESPRTPMEFRGQSLWVATGQPVLPQGAPTSPAITNALCWRMDRRLSGLSRKLGFTYTRYADDLTFSARKTGEKRAPLGVLMEGLKAVLKSEGFTLHPDKTAVMRRGSQQRVTGLIVNRAGPGVSPVRVPREVVRRLRAAIHNREKGKPGKPEESLAQLKGLAAWVFMSDPKKGGEFLSRLARLG